MRAACGWERGRSGQGKYNEEANGSQVVNALGIGRSRPARDADKLYAGGGRGAQWGESTARGRWPRAGPEGASVQEGRLLHRPRPERPERATCGPRANQKSVSFEISLLRFMWPVLILWV